MNNNLAALKAIAQALGEISSEVVFVGGATVELYIDDTAAPLPQPSEDVDCVVELLTYSDWVKFEKRLRAKGFSDYDISNEDIDPPTCRKYIMGIKVDFMPLEEKVLGYSNKWFKEGSKLSKKVMIDDVEVRVLTLEYFLATKFQAFKDRGQEDIRFSQDLEDLTELFDGVIDIEKYILNSDRVVSSFLNDCIKIFLEEESSIKEAMFGFLDYDSINIKSKRVDRIFDIFLRIVS